MDQTERSYTQTVIIALVITIALSILVFLHYRQISKTPGAIVIPAGNTYLGVTPSPAGQSLRPEAPAGSPLGGAQPSNTAVFTAASDTPWHDIHGNIYPYTFSTPTTLTLTTFPNDPYDIYAISWNNYAPSSNVLIGVDNLEKNPKNTQYIDAPKTEYVRAWWKQFGALKGIASLTEFTNKAGLKGYRAIFKNSAGETPNVDIFFEVPGHPQYVIHLANGVLDPTVFDTIVDSVSWK